MKCPIDDTELRLTERQGIEIDYCPQCRGVWLDRGELDKLIERSAPLASRNDPDDVRRRDDRDYPPDDRGYDRGHDRGHGHERGYPPSRRKRGSFLGDLFDFD